MADSLLNPNLDRSKLAAAFSRNGRVRVRDVLRADFAEAIYRCMSNDVPWRLMYYNPDAQGSDVVVRLLPEQRAAIPVEVGVEKTLSLVAISVPVRGI